MADDPGYISLFATLNSLLHDGLHDWLLHPEWIDVFLALTPAETVALYGSPGGGTVTHTTGPLTVNQLVIGNAAADVKALGAAGTTLQVLTGVTGADPAWSASPSLTGLTVDTTTLFVDSTNHRVGVGMITPGQTLDVLGAVIVRTIPSANGFFLGTAAGTLRWLLRTQNAEGGANSGSDLVLSARTDAGGGLFDAWTVARATGNTVFVGTATAPTFIGALTGNASTATLAATVTSIASHASTELSDTANIARLDAANSFTLINPITTIAESWIGPSTTNGVYFKGGNVGIGTNNPGQKFHAVGGNATGFLIDNNGSQYTEVDFAHGGATRGSWYWDETNAFFNFGLASGAYKWVFSNGNIDIGALISKYKSIATVAGGVPAEYAAIDTTGLTANIAASTLYAVPAGGEGLYRVSAYVVETVAGSVSSVLPNVQIVYTDKDSNTVVTIDATPIFGVAGIGQTGALNANTVGTASGGVIPIYVKASTTIQYQTVNYASTAAGMTYALRIRLELM